MYDSSYDMYDMHDMYDMYDGCHTCHTASYSVIQGQKVSYKLSYTKNAKVIPKNPFPV